MNKGQSVVLVLGVALSLGFASDAFAQQAQPVTTATVTPTITALRGKITTLNPPPSSFGFIKCENVVLVAYSKEQAASGGPKWRKTAVATGTWSTGTCNYVLPVQANSEFYVFMAGYHTTQSPYAIDFQYTSDAGSSTLTIPLRQS